MKKEFLNELFRIKEIMDQIISEQISPTLLPKIKNGFFRVGDVILDYVEETPRIRNLISRSGNKVRNLSDDGIELVFRNLTREGKSILAKSWYLEGKLMSPAAKQKFLEKRADIIKTDPDKYWKVMKEIVEGKKSFWGFYDEGKVPDFLNDISDEIAKLMKQDVDNFLSTEYPSSWKYIKSKGWSGKPISLVDPMNVVNIETLFKKLDPNIWKSFFNTITAGFNRLKLSAEEIQSLIAKYSGSDGATQTRIESILESSIVKFASDSEEQFNFMRKWIDTNLVNDRDLVKLKNKLLSSSNWKLAETLASTTSNQKELIAFKEAWDSMWNYSGQVLREVILFLNFKNILKKASQESIEKLKKYSVFQSDKEIIKPFRNWIISGSKRGFPFEGNPNYEKIYKVAGTKTALLSYTSEVILNLLKFHVIWAVLETTSEWFTYSFRNWFEDSDSLVANQLKKHIKDYKGSPEGATKPEIIVDILSNFLRNLSDDFISSNGLDSIVQIFPGYWDNIAHSILGIIQMGQSGEGFISDSTVKNVVDKIKKTQDKIKSETEDVIRKGKAERDSLLGQGPVSSSGPRMDSLDTEIPSDTIKNQSIDF